MKKRVLSRNVVVGVDQSARGTAAWALRDGEPVGKLFYADTVRDSKRYAGEGALRQLEAKPGDERSQIVRLEGVVSAVMGFVERHAPAHVALEGHGTVVRAAHVRTVSEISGALRYHLYRRGHFLRIYATDLVKMFGTGRGDAEKADMIVACSELWGVDVLRYGKEEGAAGNLADGLTIAKLLWTELQIRAGEVDLKSLPEKRRRVFLRTTKQEPVNVLATPFAVKGLS